MIITHHTSLILHHTSHITHHTSHITHHTSHITHHTSHITLHLELALHKRILLSWSLLHNTSASVSVMDVTAAFSSEGDAHECDGVVHVLHFILLFVTRHTSHITHHTSHITHHTSHITHHTSHITHPTSYQQFPPLTRSSP